MTYYCLRLMEGLWRDIKNMPVYVCEEKHTQAAIAA